MPRVSALNRNSLDDRRDLWSKAPQHSHADPSVPISNNVQELPTTPPRSPRLSAVIWAVLVCGALRPFVWMVRCRCCWRGRCRAVIGQHHGHLRVLQVCRVCDAARPFPAWLQPS